MEFFAQIQTASERQRQDSKSDVADSPLQFGLPPINSKSSLEDVPYVKVKSSSQL